MLHYVLNTADHELGDRPLLILMHGVSGSSLWWSTFIERFRGEFTIAAIDMLGHGLSRRVRDEEVEDLFAAVLAEQIATVEHLTRLAGRRAILIGHSMGGAVAAALADSRPDLVERIIACDPAWLSEELRQTFLDNVPAALERTSRWQRDPAGAITENVAGRPHWDPRDHSAWLHGQARVDLRLVGTGVVSFAEDWHDLVGRLTVPVHVITSSDPWSIIGLDGLRELEDLGNSLLTGELLEGVTHSVIPDDLDGSEAIVRRVLGV